MFEKLQLRRKFMFGLGAPELMIILAICFVIFGGKKLPEIGAGLGKGITSFKKGLHAVDDEPALPPTEVSEKKE
jgi:sec-independent protein translocase protein TatA